MTTILIVDDYAPNHRLMSFVLEQHGYAVVAAYDGEQALDRLNNAAIDLVLTDLTMPKMDGMALTRAIRGDARFAELPIIIVTGSTREQDHVRASGIGVNAFLTKPVESEDLVHEVSILINRDKTPPPQTMLQPKVA
ncbi:response regulator [Chloroflexales bacterium ZM16-3]|nr:response regulator [Chloroflexales bacterium ZM16-3]